MSSLIEDISFVGQGVVRSGGKVIFVPGTVIGDEVEYKIIKDKGNYALAELIKIVKPSPDRVKPICPHFGVCGGCQLQNLSYAAQLKFKENTVRQTLKRVGGIEISLEPIVPSVEYFYRNKTQIPFGMGENGAELGFFKPDSHQVVDLKTCYLQAKDMTKVMLAVKDFVNRNRISIYDEIKHKGVLRHLVIRQSDYLKELLVGIVVNGKTLPEADAFLDLFEKLKSTLDYKITSVVLNINEEKTNRILKSETKVLSGSGFITEKYGKYFFKVSLDTFLQVNRLQAEKAYDLIKEKLIPEQIVLDLYCGVGTISLYVADKSQKVVGIEENKQAIKDAKRNAQNNAIRNVEFQNGKAEFLLEKFGVPGAVIVDPPRKGMNEKVVRKLLELEPKQIIYMSCNPTTLARDLKLLSSKYKLVSITPFDFFPQTVHVEVVAELLLV